MARTVMATVFQTSVDSPLQMWGRERGIRTGQGSSDSDANHFCGFGSLPKKKDVMKSDAWS